MNEDFKCYLEEALGTENAAKAFSAFSQGASVSVRLNPFKLDAPEGLELLDHGASKVPWSPFGYMLEQRPQFTLDPLFHCGAYYVQDSSAMFVGHLLRQLLKDMSATSGKSLRVLDLCAAPGGKTTDLAASLRQSVGEDFLLVSNEVMKARSSVLADNVALWGDPNVVVTSVDPKAFSSIEGFFDIILADVPCSGEGMFRKDVQALEQWSKDNVALCEARQRRIVSDVWPSLRNGGVLIYSTCTFNRYENDGNVRWIADHLGADPFFQDGCILPGIYRTDLGWSLIPGLVEGEGQYCASLRKTGGMTWGSKVRQMREDFRRLNEKTGCVREGLFACRMVSRQQGDMLLAIPESIVDEVDALNFLHPLMKGTAVGTLKGKDLVPCADLALSIFLAADSFPRVELDRLTALSYLHRDTIVLPQKEKGYFVVCHQGHPLGFVKNLGVRCNNLHPQSRRIRMDIE